MRRWKLAFVASVAVGAGVATAVVQDVCGPFTDVSPTFCPYVLEMYYLGITAGTSPTTFSPEATVTRGQAAVVRLEGREPGDRPFLAARGARTVVEPVLIFVGNGIGVDTVVAGLRSLLSASGRQRWP